MLNSLSFSQKIIATLLALLLLFVATVGFIAVAVFHLNQQSQQTVTVDIPQLTRLANLRYKILQLRRAEKDIALDMALRPDAVGKRVDLWNDLSQQVLQLADEALRNASAEAQPALKTMQADVRAYTSGVQPAVAAVKAKTTLEMAIFDSEIDAAKKAIRLAEEQTTKQIAVLRAVTDSGSLDLAQTIRDVWWAMGVGLAVTLAAALMAGALLLRSLRVPIKELGNGIDEVRHGDLAHVVPVNSQDELGAMSTAFNAMVADLRQTVSQVRLAGESVASASAEIAQGNQELSARTEQQASALQQTAASMDTLSNTVQQNALDAQEANRLAQGASEIANIGGQAVAEVVVTMRGIETSANQISAIIQVIDGIAFQTNILALNAAVEAARAGDQGRGFAVVASEVRSLAGRSAQAAKEIKLLIDTSAARVQEGSALVGRAGTTMVDVVEAIKKVTALMGAISSSSSAQSQGVAQVGAAVAQIDQATQANAALVEQIAAAATSLTQQAQELVHTVSAFNTVPKGGVAAPATLPWRRTNLALT